MKRNGFFWLLAAFLLLNIGMPAYAATAAKATASVSVSGQPVSMEAYLVEDNHYFKLRDVAYVMNDSEKQFAVTWDETTKSIFLQSGGKYVPIGAELSQSGKNEQNDAIPLLFSVYANGSPVGMEAYLIENNTYVKLRDLGRIMDFGVAWSDTTRTVEISGEKGYQPALSEIDATKPISPALYQNLLGKGMDVDWAKTKDGRAYYSPQVVSDFKMAGINHVRIRIKDAADEALFASLDQQISDCLREGMIPVIAYQAEEMKEKPSKANVQEVVNWWTKVAEHYKDTSYLLSFDLLIEATDALNHEPEKLNDIYEQMVTAIRASNPKRILMISPRMRADAAYLKDLKVPTMHNGYLMAQWHFYASGPAKDNDRKLWTTGTLAEQQLILDKIALAAAWQQETGIPTWVGAWMPGNYNNGDNYTVEEQVVFASFMTQALSDADIPFAVNSDTKFYDRVNGCWVEAMAPVRRIIFGE